VPLCTAVWEPQAIVLSSSMTPLPELQVVNGIQACSQPGHAAPAVMFPSVRWEDVICPSRLQVFDLAVWARSGRDGLEEGGRSRLPESEATTSVGCNQQLD
jgi:hypothetical protein